MTWRVEHADALSFLKTLQDNSVDSLVSDPPAAIGFQNKRWDSAKGGRDKWTAWLAEIMGEACRVLKPGAHGLVWALPRTSHWTGVALEDGGFEVRDCLHHAFGSGFPKSLNLGNGVGTALKPGHEDWWMVRKPLAGTVKKNVEKHGTGGLNIDACRVAHASADDLAAHEAQVKSIKERGGTMTNSWKNSSDLSGANDVSMAGRWPANLLLSHSAECVCTGSRDVKANPTWDTPNRECVPTFTGETVSEVVHGDGETESIPVWQCAEDCPVRAMDGQSGITVKAGSVVRSASTRASGSYSGFNGPRGVFQAIGDTGTASRYFQQFHPDPDDVWPPFIYQAKPSRKERDAGLENFRRLSGGEATGREDESAGMNSPRAGAGRKGGSANSHPTVKSVALMRYLCRLVTPPGGTVLDIFTGSGTTGIAALREGFNFLGCDMNDTDEEPFVSIARARISYAEGKTMVPRESLRAEKLQGSLF